MPSLPGSTMDFAVIYNVKNRLPRIAALTAARVTPPEPLSGVQLKYSRAGPMNEIPVTKPGVVARLEEIVRSRVEGDCPNGFILVRKGREASM
ncbi:hypothetical protein TNCT_242301 [Trichonephila clavata]|uniref:Uncharacterized protein n=1 Tax=Trichonephila clavata TaxID=2740835 RepID=A0A8X6K8G0_TRICU|nr:hypothetical protein TNCT_242301 [Trichonephila clavata]